MAEVGEEVADVVRPWTKMKQRGADPARRRPDLGEAPPDAPDAGSLLDEAFRAAQAVHRTKAAQALALTTARFATGDGEETASEGTSYARG